MTNTSSSSSTGVSRRNDANDAYDGTQGEGIALCSALTLTFILVIMGTLLTIIIFAKNKNIRKKHLFLFVNMAFASIHLRCRLWIPPMDHVRWKRRDQQAYVNFLHDR